MADFLEPLGMLVRFRLDPRISGKLFFFLNTLRTLEAKHGITIYKDRRTGNKHTFQTRERQRTFTAPRGSS